MTLVKGLVEDLFEDIADVTLIDEDTKPILTDDANKEIPEKKDLKKTDNELNTIYDANIKQSPVKSRVCCILELK